MIYLNMKEVRERLQAIGIVYTLRKPRRTRTDVAVFGSYYNHKTIGKVNIMLVKEYITDPKDLDNYIMLSGVEGTNEEWLNLSKLLSGDILNLYRIEMIKGGE